MSTPKPRLLYVSTFMPFPATFGGKLRVGNLIRRLNATYEIHFLGLATPEECAPELLAESERFCASVTAVPHQGRRVRAALYALFTLRPYELNLFHNAAFAETLQKLYAQLQPDVLWFSRLAAAQYLAAISTQDVCTVLDQHDQPSRLWRLMEENAGQFRIRAFASFNRRLVERRERSIYPEFDLIVSTSDNERALTAAALADQGPTVIAAPNGVDIDYFQPWPEAPVPPRDLVLTGSMDQRRNIDAAVHFATEILPRLRPSFPDLRFVIVGREPAPAVRELEQLPGVVVTGTVPDVRPFLGNAAVVVAPYRFGSGMKHKLPIAMAMAKAIVASPNAVQGLDVVDGRHLLIADTPARFGERIAGLLEQPELRTNLGRAAQQLAIERYSWDRIVARLVDDLETVRVAASSHPVPAPGPGATRLTAKA